MKKIDTLAKHWQYIAPYALVPKNDEELEKQIECLDALLDTVGEDENHSLIGLVDLLSENIETYEREKFVKTVGTGRDALAYLIQSHGLSQSDLPEVGSQGVVSEILNNKRKLNRRQIEQLAKRFKVDPKVFF